MSREVSRFFEVETSSLLDRLMSVLTLSNYKDRGIQLVLLFHVAFFAFIIYARNMVHIFNILILPVGVLIYKAPVLNAQLQQNWYSYGFSRNYFDSECLFFFVFIVVPLSLNAVIMLVFISRDIYRTIAARRYFNELKHRIVQDCN